MDVASLHEKYVILEALRVARRDAPTAEPPLAALRELARRFPGALRELERMPFALLVARRESLVGVLTRGEEEPLWSTAQRRYHAELRAAIGGAGGATRGKERLTVWATHRVATALDLDIASCRALLFPWLS